MNCPNKNSQEWKSLVGKYGEEKAEQLYDFFDGDFDKMLVDDQNVNYEFKSISILQSDKAKQVFDKGNKNNWSLDKILTELAIPKEQKQLLLDLGINDREQLALELASKYSYSVEVKTAKENSKLPQQPHPMDGEKSFTVNGDKYSLISNVEFDEDGPSNITKAFKNGKEISIEEYLKGKQQAADKGINTSYYSNLTVPGGTNYTENEISTPLIIPSIKGHAQFSSDNGIGWFRSDEQFITSKDYPSSFKGNYGDTWEKRNNIWYTIDSDGITHKRDDLTDTDVYAIYDNQYSNKNFLQKGENTKTRRILELQSDLFQKGRDKEDLVALSININTIESLRERGKLTDDEYNDYLKTINRNASRNNFLQLLNKDNNWVTFFIKSIIQDSVKKGYNKVLFPTGDTSIKIESPGTGIRTINEAKEQNQEALANTGLFYEIKVSNILDKQFGKDNVKIITDEYGNQWKEIDIDVKRDLSNIKLQKISKDNKELIENIKNKQLENSTPIETEKLTSILDGLKNKFGINYALDSDLNAHGAFINGIVVINPLTWKADTPFHEFCHPFIDAVKKKNPTLYNELAKEISSDKELMAYIEENYGLDSIEDKIEEAIVQRLGEYAANLNIPQAKKSKLQKLLDKILEWISSQLKSTSAILTVEKLNPNMTLKELGLAISSVEKVSFSSVEEIQNEYQQMYNSDPVKNRVLRIVKSIFGEENVTQNGVVTIKDLTNSDIEYVNSLLQREYTPETWRLARTNSGNYYIAGYKNKGVFFDGYYSPNYSGKYQKYSRRSFEKLSPKMQNAVRNFENEIRDIYKAIRVEKNEDSKLRLKSHVDFLQGTVDNIVNSGDAVQILSVASEELDKISAAIESKDLTVDYLRIALTMTDFYVSISNYLPDNKGLSDDARIVSERALTLRNKLENAALNELSAIAKKGGVNLSVEDLVGIKSEFGRALTLSADNAVSQSVQYLANIINDAQKRRNDFVVSTVQRFNELKNKANVKNDYTEYLDNNGSLILPIKQEWYKQLEDLKSKEDQTEYHEFIKNHTIRIDPSKLNNSKYLSTLEKQIPSSVLRDMYIKSAKDKLEKYNQDLEAFSKLIVHEKPIDESDSWTKTQVDKFIEENSPIRFFEESEKQFKDSDFFKNFKGRKYTEFAAKTVDSKGERTDWYNDKFENIASNPAKLEFYNYMFNTTDKLLDFFPKYLTKDLERGFLLNIEKDEVQRILKGGFNNINAAISDFLLKNLTSENRLGEDKDLIFKNLQIPHDALMRKLDSDLRSTDLGVILEKMTYLASNYYFMSNVESQALLVNRFIQQAKDNGKTFMGAGDQTKAQANYTLMSNLYGKKKVDTAEEKMSFVDKRLGSKKYTEADKKKIKDLNLKLEALKMSTEKGIVSQEEYEQEKIKIENQINTIGRQSSFTDLAEAAMNIAYKKAFFYNPFPGAANLLTGVAMNFLRGTGSLDYDNASLFKSYKLMTKAIGDVNTRRKIQNLSDRFGIVTNISAAEFGRYSDTAKKESKYDDMMFMRGSDKFIKNQQMLAYLTFNKIKTKTGNEISYLDAFDNSGKWRNELFDDETNKQYNGDLLNKDEMTGFRKLQDKVIVVSRTHGNMDPDSSVLYKQHVFGNLIGMFRFSWMGESVDYRFAPKYYNQKLEREVEGIYKSVYTLYKDKGFLGATVISLEQMLRMLTPFMSTNINKRTSLTKQQESALKQTLAEANMILVLFAVIAMLKPGDDDDEQSKTMKLFINQAIRLQTDIRFYMGFDFVSAPQQNLIPAWSVISDTKNALISIGKYAIDDEYKGETAIKNVLKAIPGGNVIRQVMVKSDKIIE